MVNYALTIVRTMLSYHGWPYHGYPWLTKVNYALTMVRTMLSTMLGYSIMVDHAYCDWQNFPKPGGK